MIRPGLFAGFLGATLTLFGPASAQAGADAAARVQEALEAWLAQRAPVEGVTGIAAYISFGDPSPAIEAFAGKVGRDPDDPPVDQDTLFHMGSTSKSFAAAAILKLEADGKLSLMLYQRSADFFLGVPFNIASYALLTHMVAQQTDLLPGELIWTGGDCHLYLNHLEVADEQLKRTPRPLPKLVIKRRPASLFEYRFEDFEIVGYDAHPAIKAPVAV